MRPPRRGHGHRATSSTSGLIEESRQLPENIRRDLPGRRLDKVRFPRAAGAGRRSGEVTSRGPGDDDPAGHLFPSPRRRLDHDLYERAFRAWVPLVTAVLQAAHYPADQGLFEVIQRNPEEQDWVLPRSRGSLDVHEGDRPGGERTYVITSEIEREQDYVARLYERVDLLREQASARLARTLGQSGGTPQARIERDVAVARYAERVARL